MICPKCGNPLIPDMKFCTKCGTPVPQHPPVRQNAPVAQPKQHTVEKPKEFLQYGNPNVKPPQITPQNVVVQQPKKQKNEKKKKSNKNLPLIIIAIVLAIAVAVSGCIVGVDIFKNSKEKEGALYIDEFPVLKQKTEFMVYDVEKFPAEEYEIKVERMMLGGILKSEAFRGETVVEDTSTEPVYNIDFDKDGDYRITITDITPDNTQTTLTTTDSGDSDTTTITIIIDVKVDDDAEDSVDKVTLNSKEGDEPIKDFVSQDSVAKESLFVKNNVLSAGTSHTVGLKTDGTVVATGQNYSGQCNVDGWKNIIGVSAGDRHTVALKSDGTVVAVGDNSYGQCNVSGWQNIIAVSAGWFHTVALKSDGTVLATGATEGGRCDVGNWKDIIAVAACNSHTLGLKSDGTVVISNNNDYVDQSEVNAWDDIVAISANGHSSVGLKSDGTVEIVADGMDSIEKETDLIAVAAGNYHIIGIKSDGTVVTNKAQSDYFDCTCDEDIRGWKDIVAVASGEDHIVGLKKDGTVEAVGNNAVGQCNVSDWTDIAMPGTEKITPNEPVENESSDKTESITSNKVNVGDYIKFGKYEQDNNTSNGNEDIEWLVLEVEDGKALVISKCVLACCCGNRCFGDTVSRWDTSEVRKWLNDGFVNEAFSESEKKRLIETTVNADPNPDCVCVQGSDTQDKVFLLSVNEVEKYLNSSDKIKGPLTEYCMKNSHIMRDSDTGCGWWMLRTSAGGNCYVFVYDDIISTAGRFDDMGIRPAMWVTL